MIMKDNLQSPDLRTSKTTGEGVLGEGAEKYIRNVADIEDLPGDKEDEEIEEDEDEDDMEEIDYDHDVDDVETERALEDTTDDEEDEDYINKDEARRDLRERGLRPE